MAAYVFSYVGDYHGAIDHQMKAVELNQQLGRPDDQITVLHSLTIILTRAGHFEPAREISGRALNLARESKDPLQIFYANDYCGNLQVAMENYAAAADCYLEMQPHIDLISERRIEWLMDTAHALVRAERQILASNYFDILQEATAGTPVDPRSQLRVRHIEAELLHADGNAAAAFPILKNLYDEKAAIADRRQQQTIAQLRLRLADEAAHLKKLEALNTSVLKRQRTIIDLVCVLAIGAIMAAGLLLRYGLRLKRSSARNVQLLREAEWLAHRDPLTSLLNRRGFFEALETHFLDQHRASKSIAIGVLDLDRFKTVNDVFGHQVGDDLLIEVASRLTKALGQDIRIARLGGDEFAFLVSDVTNSKQIETLARDICETLALPTQIRDAHLTPRGSLGMAVHHGAADSPDELYNNADYALYQAKQKQKGSYKIFDDVLRADFERLNAVERAINKAIPEDFTWSINQSLILAPGSQKVLKPWCVGAIPCRELFRR